ncbi:Protein hunchback [Eumeta japonica]|uniref:Protein hunchback n=1 Tax=Eumeta variegata TaxID=151549 RepID=A0A4C1UI74_EUMVA|nr:Protein hunchback [Eumeta japonica]
MGSTLSVTGRPERGHLFALDTALNCPVYLEPICKYSEISVPSMLSCAAPARAGLPAPHARWPPLLQPPPPTVKSEPVDPIDEGVSFNKDQASGFYSEGFHSASPSSSSKDSTGHSPRSVTSGGEPSPSFYDGSALHAKADLGARLDAYGAGGGLPYSLLTPPGFETRPADGHTTSPRKEVAYSPRVPHGRPCLASTPLGQPDATPPKSPRTPPTPPLEDDQQIYDRFHDSGFEGTARPPAHDPPDARATDRDGSGPDETEYDDEPGLRVPAVNSHGKVKTFKCKQCEFVAVTKLSFWEHSKEHIKPEKMLTCPKCPFVTEYKHHLEYHMRNHFGSKPFQCSQCSYSCVNKSMLNSHLKSHSNVYQYRCADCNYATKYCHSLKLHLRKYKHNPAMVLNLDGTPNPLPIIDVYGTRRGPKQKSVPRSIDRSAPAPHSHSSHSAQPPHHTPHALFGNRFPVGLPYLPPLLPHSFLFPPNGSYERAVSPRSDDNPPVPTAASILHQRLSYAEREAETVDAVQSPNHRSAAPAITPPAPPKSKSPAAPEDALDLTSSKLSEAGSPPPASRPMPNTPTTSLKNRRKGRAFKLQPAALRLQHQEDRSRENDTSDSDSDTSADGRGAGGGAGDAGAASTSGRERADGGRGGSSYACHYCDITFGDLTMHTIHMGFHGYNDPFMCNKCGERSTDRVAFFIHLGRAQHA